MNETIKRPRGTKDILPQEQNYWRYIENIVEKKFLSFDFGKITTPSFEHISLFNRGVGETSDIVQKEMFLVKKSDITESDNEENYVLRPEGTAGIVRAYLEKGMQVWPQPVKLYYFEPMFRYCRPQKGRYREFWQFGFEIIGSQSTQTDILSIMLIWQIFNDLGLSEKDIIIDINTIGCKNCRNKINKSLAQYFQKYQKNLCPTCQSRFLKNPLRILDCKETKCQKIISSAPQIIDSVCKNCKLDFKQVLEGLDELNIPYDLNPKLVRGLDYYTKTTFEVRDLKDKTRQSSLGGGGRYDDLVEQFGGNNTPAIGFAAGIERIVNILIEKQTKISTCQKSEIYVIQIGDKAEKKALKLIYDLSNKGFNVNCTMGKTSLKSQLKSANKSGAKLALILGQREIFDKSIIVRDMQDSSQESIPFSKVEELIYRKLRS